MDKFIYILLTLISLLYFLSPVDLIPDIIPLLGYLDDFLFLAFSVYSLYKSFAPAEEKKDDIIDGTYTIIEEEKEKQLPSQN